MHREREIDLGTFITLISLWVVLLMTSLSVREYLWSDAIQAGVAAAAAS